MKTLSFFLFYMAIGTVFVIGACDRKSNSAYQKKEAAITDKNITQTGKTGSREDPADRCIHNASKNVCFICEASLRDPMRLWCKEHNCYEDRCFKCHPEAQEKGRLYCTEHSLYEDECFLCHPELKAGAGDTPAQGGNSSITQCKEHGVPEVECGICHPELLGRKNPGEGLKIRFESSQSAQKAGVLTTTPDSVLAKGGLSFPARTGFNENTSAVILARYAGTITSVKVDLGAKVRKGQVLATVSSPELAQIVAEFRSVENETRVKEAEYLREKELFGKNVSSRQDLDNAAAIFNRARNTSEALRQRLINSEITIENLTGLPEQNAVPSEFAIRAPISGTVVRRSTAVGQSVIADTPVMMVVDLSSLWIHVSVPLYAGIRLAPGDFLKIAFDGNTSFPAKIDWVSPEVDRASGTILVRAELKNPEARFKSGVFCRAFLDGESNRHVFTVPSDAVASIDGNDVIFTKVESDLYQVKRVSVDGVVDGKAIISQGLSQDDQVVVAGTFVVKSEFLKSRLGAGCVDE